MFVIFFRPLDYQSNEQIWFVLSFYSLFSLHPRELRTLCINSEIKKRTEVNARVFYIRYRSLLSLCSHIRTTSAQKKKFYFFRSLSFVRTTMLFCTTSGIKSQNDKNDQTWLDQWLTSISFTSIARIQRILSFAFFNCYQSYIQNGTHFSPLSRSKSKKMIALKRNLLFSNIQQVMNAVKHWPKNHLFLWSRSIRLDWRVFDGTRECSNSNEINPI